MTDLFEKSIQTLELPRVLERLADQAVTEEGKERCLALRPMTDRDDVQRALDETTAAVNMTTLRGSPSFSGVRPVGASLQRANMGGPGCSNSRAGCRRPPVLSWIWLRPECIVGKQVQLPKNVSTVYYIAPHLLLEAFSPTILTFYK